MSGSENLTGPAKRDKNQSVKLYLTMIYYN